MIQSSGLMGIKTLMKESGDCIVDGFKLAVPTTMKDVSGGGGGGGQGKQSDQSEDNTIS